MKANIVSVNAVVQRIKVESCEVEFLDVSNEKLFKDLQKEGAELLCRVEITYFHNEQNKTVKEQKNVKAINRWGTVMLRAYGSAIGGDLFTDIKISN